MATSVLSRADRDELVKLIRTNAKTEEDEVLGENPNLIQDIEDKARKMAIFALGINKELTQYDKLEKQIAELEKARDELEGRIRKRLPRRTSHYHDACPDHMSICEAINALTAKTRAAAEARIPAGKRLQQIEKKLQAKLAALSACTKRDEVKDSGCLDW